jgi:hypothetical protein
VAIERLTGAAMVAASSSIFAQCYLYSVALACEVDPGSQFTLSDRQAEVSFKLFRVWRAAGGRALPPTAAAEVGVGPAAPDVRDAAVACAAKPEHAEDKRMEDEEDEEEEGAYGPLAWEPAEVPLPADWTAVYHRFTEGRLQVDAKTLLDGCPRWAAMKQRAEQNNHRQDAGRQADKVLRVCQQKLIGLQRLYPLVHQELNEAAEDYEETKSLSQQVFGLLLEVEKFILQERKRMSLPGSIVAEGPQLFSAEDLKLQAEQQKINAASGYFPIRHERKVLFPSQRMEMLKSPAVVVRSRESYICPPTGYKGARFKGGKGRTFKWSGRGKGGKPSWGKGFRAGSSWKGSKGGKCPGPAGTSTHSGLALQASSYPQWSDAKSPPQSFESSPHPVGDSLGYHPPTKSSENVYQLVEKNGQIPQLSVS